MFFTLLVGVFSSSFSCWFIVSAFVFTSFATVCYFHHRCICRHLIYSFGLRWSRALFGYFHSVNNRICQLNAVTACVTLRNTHTHNITSALLSCFSLIPLLGAAYHCSMLFSRLFIQYRLFHLICDCLSLQFSSYFFFSLSISSSFSVSLRSAELLNYFFRKITFDYCFILLVKKHK